MELSIKLELVSLIIIMILFLFHYDYQRRRNVRYQLFNVCLLMTAGTIITNIITCFMIANSTAYSYGLHMIMHSLYFLCINSCLSMVAAYVFYLLFEHMPAQKCYKIAKTLICTLWSFLILLTVLNVWTGCYFYIENGVYCRGPLNKIGFVVLMIEVAMLCMCFIRNRKVITPYAIQLVRLIPPIALLMTILQLAFPNTILTGTVAALVNLILFACFQSNRMGRDALTELQNRPGFFESLAYYKKKKKTAHIVLVRLKNVDKINKRYGMRNGDILLYNVARFLENLNSSYQVYRYGNTQFVMLGEFTTMDKTEKFVADILKRFESNWDVNGKKWKQYIQLIHLIGSDNELEGNVKEEQLNFIITEDNIDANTVTFFDEEMEKTFARKNFVLQEVKRAIKEESFELYYQPIYSCKEKRFTTAEVLSRLFTKDGELISPAEFIPISEEYNLSDEITWIVLKKSMEYLAAHPELILESISVNMSIQQLNKKYLMERVAVTQKKYGKLLYKLRIEITENTISQNPDVVGQMMEHITNEGAAFYLDDFGVGYSNLSRMFELPFEVIKIDRSLIKNIGENEKTDQMLESIVETLHNAGFKVVAEGLETENQVKRAQEIGVDRIQGFYYARPMNGDALLEFLQKEI